jgi:hypothetical protein
MFRLGSFSDFGVVLNDVRFTPDSDRTADIAGGPFCANFGSDPSLDDKICAAKQRRRKFNAE